MLNVYIKNTTSYIIFNREEAFRKNNANTSFRF